MSESGPPPSTDGAARSCLEPLAAVESWRARGAALVDPVGFGVIESLARRAALQQGPARQLLMRRVEELLAAHAARSSRATPTRTVPDEPAPRRGALAGLSDLIDRLGRSPAAPAAEPLLPRPGAVRPADLPRAASLAQVSTPGALKAVTAYRDTWSRLRADQRLRQALAQVPAMAGPLNSSLLVNRALQAMRDVSPAYLDAFMLHVDTLLWLEQARDAEVPTPRPATPTEGRRRPGTRASRQT